MIFDAHGDILTDVSEQLNQGNDIWENYHKQKYESGELMGSIFVNFTNPNDNNQREQFDIINRTSLDYFKNRDDINIIHNKDNFDFSKFNLIFGIEGLNPVDGVSELKALYEMGYRHIGLTWNEKNKFASGAFEKGGLTNLGKDLVKAANQLGMIVDYAHLNKESFCDVAKLSDKPIFVSHANSKSVCDHPRNLDDEQIQLVKESNGVIGIAVMSFFLNEKAEDATIYDVIKHIKYISNNFGVEYVGFGFDFCYYLDERNGKNKVEELEHIYDASQIVSLLKSEGFSKEEIEKICYKNMLRVIGECL